MDSDQRTLIICATPRSGSYLLCEALRLTGRAGNPEEYLWRPNAERFANSWGVSIDQPGAYPAALAVHAAPSGMLATKVMWGYAGTAGRVMRGGAWNSVDDDGAHADAALLTQTTNPLFVYMHRHDTAAQAVSYSKAVKADAWAKLAETGDVPGEMPVLDDSVRVNRAARPVGMQDYDFDHINYFHDEILSHNRGWESFFRDHDIAPLEVTYERLVAEFETVALEIVDALGNSPSDVTFGERRMQKQRDGVSKRWLIRFREDLIAHEIRRRWASTRGLDLDEADPLTPSAR